MGFDIDAKPLARRRGPLRRGSLVRVRDDYVVALRRAELLANSGALAEASPARPVIVAVSNRPGRGASVKQLRRLAQRHVERLLLVPYIAGLAEGQPAQAEAELEDTFSALATLLRRPE